LFYLNFISLKDCGDEWRENMNNGTDTISSPLPSSSLPSSSSSLSPYLNQGSVYIDGIDISLVNLPVLRQSIAYLSQEPVLFSGWIRNNVDMKGVLLDGDLWNALEAV
jgi:hypothetical protein